MWEDDANKRGGRWLISLDKKQRNNDLDRYWLDIVSMVYVKKDYHWVYLLSILKKTFQLLL